MAAITKSAPSSDSRWSSVLRTVSGLSSPATSRSPSSCITPRRPSSMSMSVTVESRSEPDWISRRRSTGTKLELPPPMIVTLNGMVVSPSAHRVVGHRKNRGLEDPAGARPADRVHDRVGHLLRAQHPGQVGILGRAALAHRKRRLDAAGREDRAAHAAAEELMVERAHEADLGVLRGG